MAGGAVSKAGRRDGPERRTVEKTTYFGKDGDEMLTIIEVEVREDGGHGLQSQSGREACWLEGWIAVPEELAEAAWACGGYCDLDVREGVLVGLTPRERPVVEHEWETEISEQEQLRADVDFLAALQGVTL